MGRLYETCTGPTPFVFGLKEKAGRGHNGFVRGIVGVHVDKG